MRRFAFIALALLMTGCCWPPTDEGCFDMLEITVDVVDAPTPTSLTVCHRGVCSSPATVGDDIDFDMNRLDGSSELDESGDVPQLYIELFPGNTGFADGDLLELTLRGGGETHALEETLTFRPRGGCVSGCKDAFVELEI